MFNKILLISLAFLLVGTVSALNDEASTVIDFNEPESTTYYPSSITTLIGTNDTADNVSLISTYNDGLSYNVSEVGGTPAYDIRINFTDVSDFDFGATNIWYDGSISHDIEICLWNYVTSSWDCLWDVSYTDDFQLVSGTVFDAQTYYIDGGLVQVKLEHDESGNPTHDLYIDYFIISSGGGVIFSNAHDSLTGRDNILVNHPNSASVFWKNDGTSTATGNWNLNNHNLTTSTGTISAYYMQTSNGLSCTGDISFPTGFGLEWQDGERIDATPNSIRIQNAGLEVDNITSNLINTDSIFTENLTTSDTLTVNDLDVDTDATIGGNLYLDTNSKIDFNSGDVTLTHSTNKLTMAGGDLALVRADASILTASNFISSTNYISTNGYITVGNYLTTQSDITLDKDNGYLYLGEDQDMRLFHSGTHGYINSTTGNLYLDSIGKVIDFNDCAIENIGAIDLENITGDRISIGTEPVLNDLLIGEITGSNVKGIDLDVTQSAVGTEVHSAGINIDGTIQGGASSLSDVTLINLTGSANSPTSVKGIRMTFAGSGANYPLAIALTNTGSGFTSNILDIDYTGDNTATVGRGYNYEGTITPTRLVADNIGTRVILTDTGAWGNDDIGHWTEVTVSDTSGTGTTQGIGYRAVVSSTTAYTDVLADFYGQYKPYTTGEQAYGLYLDNTATATINNPTQFQTGIYVNNDRLGTDTGNKAWSIYNAGTDTDGSEIFLGGDNIRTYFGTGFDSWMYDDGTNFNFNSSSNRIWTFGNSTGLGTIRYGSALTSTTVDNSTDALEDFNLGSELYNPDGSINHTAFGECYRQVEETNYSDCYEVYDYTEYCYLMYNNETSCGEQIIDWETYEFNGTQIFLSEELIDHYVTECGTYLIDTVDLTCEQAQQRQALALLNRNIDVEENLTKFTTSTIAEHYVTNTTKEPETLTKIENFYQTLPDMSYQDMKDIVLDGEGKLSDNILFDYEQSEYGSYNLEAIGHSNRAMLVMMMWKIANIEDKQNQQLDCWDLTTQQEIIQCMRNIN